MVLVGGRDRGMRMAAQRGCPHRTASHRRCGTVPFVYTHSRRCMPFPCYRNSTSPQVQRSAACSNRSLPEDSSKHHCTGGRKELHSTTAHRRALACSLRSTTP
jgi:hypothetical protein